MKKKMMLQTCLYDNRSFGRNKKTLLPEGTFTDVRAWRRWSSYIRRYVFRPMIGLAETQGNAQISFACAKAACALHAAEQSQSSKAV